MMPPIPQSIQSVDFAFTLFAGFLQKGFTDTNGLLLIDNYIRQLCNGRMNVRVSLHPWKANEKDAAETIWRLRPRDKKQVHGVIGYSYGGDRAVKYCWELAERSDCEIAFLVLIDPVVRCDYFPGIAAVTGLGDHDVPDLVGKVAVFGQSSRRWAWGKGRPWHGFEPKMHPVYHEDELVEPTVLQTSHSYIDNSHQVRNTCLELVHSVLHNEEPQLRTLR